MDGRDRAAWMLFPRVPRAWIRARLRDERRGARPSGMDAFPACPASVDTSTPPRRATGTNALRRTALCAPVSQRRIVFDWPTRPDPPIPMQTIQIRGARTHNLKNVDLDLPRDRL